MAAMAGSWRVRAAALLALALVAAAAGGAAAVSCRSIKDTDVDWWVVMKMPIIAASSNPDAQNGYAFAYMDSTTSGLQVQSFGLDKDAGALGHTLAQLYGNPHNYAWLMYNDEDPSGSTTESRGHTKGVVAYDDNGGWWLVHSVPRFPEDPTQGSYSFPDDERKYGQSMLCLSLSLSTLDTVGSALQYNYANMYAHYVPSDLTGSVPNIDDFIGGAHVTDPDSLVKTISTVGGQSAVLFAKSMSWGKDLYEDLVAPQLGYDMQCETWLRDPKLPTFCRPQYKYDIVNIQQVQPPGTDMSFTETADHSKWAVTIGSNSYGCIGDINRMSSQEHRGGGTVCVINRSINAALKSWILSADSCTSDARLDAPPPLVRLQPARARARVGA